MGKKEYPQNEAVPNVLNDEAAAYENLEIRRRKESILSSDTEKFKMFTKLMRIGIMLKNAKVTHKKMIE
jgi:hypothetical protein